MHTRLLSLVVLPLLFAARPVCAQPPATDRVLVVPFENSRKEPHVGWLGEAAAVLVADELNARGVAAIRRPERVHAFGQLHLPLTGNLTRATVIKVGQLVGASEVVVGSYSVDNDRLRVEAHSIRTDVGRLEPDVTEQAPLEDLFGIFQRVARQLSPGRGAGESPARAAQPPLRAFEHYIKGLIAENAATQATFLETAVREFRGFDRAQLALWQVRYEQGNHEAALAAARSVAADSPLSARARFRAAVSLMELKRYDESFEAFKKLLAIKPPADLSDGAIAPVLNNLGVLLIRRGATPQTGSPAFYLTKAADADGSEPDYRFNLGYAYALVQNYTGAIFWLRETVRRDPADADAHYVLAAALQASGSAVEAARERDLARQLSAQYEARPANDQSIPPGLERVRTELESPRDMRAEKAIVNAAQREQRELAAFHLEQGRRLFEKEQDREAMAELRRAVYLLPYEAEAHLLMGRIQARAGRPHDAIEALKISLWSQETAAARIALAEAYMSMRNTASARKELERALVLDPASTPAKQLLSSLQ